ncbi:universal stress protein [Neptuniibacter pectenicola]|mgnify:FL=1|jgi:nucleotide-binding universal stress UspA family protein|uniref:universal stress protein n=1 Tax=Neptuniibacter pectenicola TaxID=1806669 RepID=UPI00082FA6A3|nr:universal stress protein [Neptuniibacter pectenicola]|tara:strand:- start:232 stop:672 length:441 start_codon:yes stop_codon:yes gene_type:complete
MYQNILIPLDLSHKSQAVELANVAIALTAGQPATVHLLYVDQSFVHRAAYPNFEQSNLALHKEEALSEMSQLLVDVPDNVVVKTHCRRGTAHDQILEVALELKNDAIVMMAKKPGISSYFIGSNAERVVRHAACSVFVVRDNESHQ